MDMDNLGAVGLGLPMILLDAGTDFTTFTDLGSKLTVTALLLLGLHFLNKQKQQAEIAREQTLKESMNEVKESYRIRLEEKDELITELREKNEELNTQILSILKKVNIPGE